MAIVRAKHGKDKPFVQVTKSLVCDHRLTGNATKVALFILSHPSDWQINTTYLIKNLKMGRHAVRAALKNLEEHGYLKREMLRTKDGCFSEMDYTLYEDPYDCPTQDDDPPGRTNSDTELSDIPQSSAPSTVVAPVSDNSHAVNDDSILNINNNIIIYSLTRTHARASIYAKKNVGSDESNIIQFPRSAKTTSVAEKVTPQVVCEEPMKSTKPEQLKLFDLFYQHYPIKKAKQAALRAFLKLKPDLPLTQELINAVEAQNTEREIKIKHGLFVPEWKHPATWLNQGCWEDEVLTEEQILAQAPAIYRKIAPAVQQQLQPQPQQETYWQYKERKEQERIADRKRIQAMLLAEQN